MLRPYAGTVRDEGAGIFRHTYGGIDEFLHTLSFAGNQFHHGDPKRGLEHRSLHVNPVRRGDIDHIEANHHRHRQGQQLRHQIKVSLQRGDIDDGHHRVRPLVDEVFASNPFLFQPKGQTVGPG